MTVSQTTLDGVVLYRLVRRFNNDEFDADEVVADIDEIIEDYPTKEYGALIAMANVIHATAAAVYKFKTGEPPQTEEDINAVLTALVEAVIKAEVEND